jgi:hypothetical protein
MVISSVINEPTSAIAKFSVIVKIHKYRRFHEGAPLYSDGHGGA